MNGLDFVLYFLFIGGCGILISEIVKSKEFKLPLKMFLVAVLVVGIGMALTDIFSAAVGGHYQFLRILQGPRG